MEYEKQLIIMNNIDRLLKKRNMKRGSFEKEVGISRGYLSRLKKPNPVDEGIKISFELLEKIACKLNVSMDYLMLNSIENTTDENALIDFIESLYTMSAEDTLFWNVFTRKQIDGIDDPDDFDKLGPISKRVFKTDEYDSHALPCEYCWIGWLSLGHGRKIGDTIYTNVTLIDDFFYAYIEKIESTLYLYRMGYTDANGQHKLSNVIEAYLVNAGDIHFLCNSVEWNEYISSKLRDLYQIARDSSSVTRLDEGARKLLNLFNVD